LRKVYAHFGPTKEAFRSRIEQLIRLKNDFKHDRGPKTEEDLRQATTGTQEALQDVMRELGFFTEHPIRLIRDVSGIRGSRSVNLNTLLTIGDHPGFTQQQINYPEPLTKNDLYIEAGKDDWTALYPFLVPYNCPQCKNREFYFIDRWQGKTGPATLKSFEHGHSQSINEIGNALGTV